MSVRPDMSWAQAPVQRPLEDRPAAVHVLYTLFRHCALCLSYLPFLLRWRPYGAGLNICTLKERSFYFFLNFYSKVHVNE